MYIHTSVRNCDILHIDSILLCVCVDDILFTLIEYRFQSTDKVVSGSLTLKLPGPYVGMGGSLTVTVA